MALEGADIAALRSMAKKFNASGNQLTQLGAQISSAVQHTQAWRGGDADRFRSDWQSHQRVRLTKVAQALGEAAKEIDKNANEQEKASGAGGGGHGGKHESGGGGIFSKVGGFLKDKWESIKNDWPKYAIKAGGIVAGFIGKKLLGPLVNSGLSKLIPEFAGGAPVVGAVIAGLTAGGVQWWEDRNKGYSVPKEIGRIAVKSVCTGVGSGLGQAGGAALGGVIGGALGIETGPGAIGTGGVGALVGGVIGGAVGGFAGGKVGDLINDHFLS